MITYLGVFGASACQYLGAAGLLYDGRPWTAAAFTLWATGNLVIYFGGSQ